MSPRRARNAAGDLLESAFQAQVVGLFRVYGWKVYHAPDGGKAGRVQGGQLPDGRGFPDLIALNGPRLIAAELKTDTGRLGPGQAEWLEAFQRVASAIGAHLDGHPLSWKPVDAPRVEAFLWRPKDWDAIHDTIRGPLERRRDLDPDPLAVKWEPVDL